MKQSLKTKNALTLAMLLTFRLATVKTTVKRCGGGRKIFFVIRFFKIKLKFVEKNYLCLIVSQFVNSLILNDRYFESLLLARKVNMVCTSK